MSRALAVLAILVTVSPAVAQEMADSSALAADAFRVLKQHCHRCHGVEQKVPDFRVLRYDSLTKNRGEPNSLLAYVVPGKLDVSEIWTYISGDAPLMPLAGSPESKAMTPADRDVLKRWIEAGAPRFPQGRSVAFLSDAQVYQAIRDYLLTVDAADRPHLRFFTLTNWSNNPEILEDDLRLFRAALSKAVYSLTWQQKVVVPQALPKTGDTVYVIDISRLGWHQQNLWIEVLKQYPYGLELGQVQDDDALRQAALTVQQLIGRDLAVIRADWFIATATRPPLYHTLLNLPTQLAELEHRLGVTFEESFLKSTAANQRLARAGFAQSGVSKQNRLIERHEIVGGYYWISYDFKPRKARGDLVRFPLGPAFANNPFRTVAFDHDGGEVIFSLPNGMQAYLLVNSKGGRIDEGPIDVVYDARAISGTPLIVNGLSCMNCHRQGMISEFRDEIRQANAVAGNVLAKVQDLYPAPPAMAALVADDERRFLAALERVTGPFLKVGDDSAKPIGDFAEPVGRVAEIYLKDLGPTEIAIELGLPSADALQTVIRTNRSFLRFGLGTLVQNPPGTIKREKWEARDGTSLMQDIAAQIRLGVVPLNY